jgi:glycosyltransferase involved in cell wall biosynthesis
MKYWKSLNIEKRDKIRIVAASYLNGDKRRYPACKSFINSILAQTYDNFELFIVHDGPIDDCEEKVDLLESIKDSRIKLFQTKERMGKFGYPHRKNYGFINNDFDWIIWTNDDNFYVPTALEILLHGCQKLDKDIVFCNMISSHAFWFPLVTEFKPDKLDLGGFIIKKEVMKQFDFQIDGDCTRSDAKMIAELSLKVDNDRMVKIDNFLFIHN